MVTEIKDGVEYNLIDPSNLLFPEPNAEKFTPVHATPVTAEMAAKMADGLQTRMDDGHIETKNSLKEGDWIVSNYNTIKPDEIPGYDSLSTDEQVLARTGPAEEYVVKGEEFTNTYTLGRKVGEGFIAHSSDAPVPVVELEKNVVFTAPWGENMYMKAGDVLVNNGTTPEGNPDIYGIRREEFEETYGVPGSGRTFEQSGGFQPEKTPPQNATITELQSPNAVMDLPAHVLAEARMAGLQAKSSAGLPAQQQQEQLAPDANHAYKENAGRDEVAAAKEAVKAHAPEKEGHSR